MAWKKSKAAETKLKDATHVKYVRKAHLWCKTIIANGKQTQEWSSEKPQ